MGRFRGTLALLFMLVVSCSITQSVDSLTDGQCSANLKACGNRCVPIDNPETGCASNSCSPCSLSHASAKCSEQGECSIAGCENGFDDCDDVDSNGCEANLTTDVAHCKSCGRSCQATSGKVACIDGVCAVTSCNPGFENCNNSYGDGCEANLGTDSQNCGFCGNICPNNRQCEGGKCISVVQIVSSASALHSCALLNSGVVYCWGENSKGQVGDGKGCALPPCSITNAEKVVNISAISSVAIGKRHTCAVNQSGIVFCWGDNQLGQLGIGQTETEPRLQPRSLTGIQSVSEISAGESHTCARLSDGTVWCWGGNPFGQVGVGPIGQNVSSPTQVMVGAQPLSAVVSMCAGNHFSCAVSNGTVYCWGDNTSGQLGNGSTSSDVCVSGESKCSGQPSAMLGITDAVQVACGADVVCVVRGDAAGTVMCSGDGSVGKLGTGMTTSSDVPVGLAKVPGLTRLVAIHLGKEHACGLQSQSSNVWCWGHNHRGQLVDDPSQSVFLVPTLRALSGIEQVVTGENFTCFLSDGRVTCAGDNSVGQLGKGNIDSLTHPSPTLVLGLP
jgi:alpha-tubulin suppressor-like RCC1 family protein